MDTTGPAKATASDLGDGVGVFLEQCDGVLLDVSLELLGKARELATTQGCQVVGYLLGARVDEAAADAAARGADLVLVAADPALARFDVMAATAALQQLLARRRPQMLLVPATNDGVDLAARLAVREGLGLISHVVELGIDPHSRLLLGSVPTFGGSILAVCSCPRTVPQMATVRPGIFVALQPGATSTGAVEQVSVVIPPAPSPIEVMERSVGAVEDITKAERIVIAGLGISDGLDACERIAKAWGAVLGVSRPLADRGLAPKERVIGSTGVSVGSKAALVVGVSGASHFLSGIAHVEKVIALNTDAQAPILPHADVLLVGDAAKVLPLVLAQLPGGAP